MSNLSHREETIVAPATAKVPSALGIVRLSGDDALKIVDKVFKAKNNKSILSAKANTCHFGEIIFNERVIDQVVCTIFLAPHSFTGENIVEISHHGSPYIQERLLQALISSGARMAERGEFSERAFLCGKINLSQAEAIADIIACRNDFSHNLAIKQLRDDYTLTIKELREKFLKIASLLELEIDFSEEHEIFVDREELKLQIDQAKDMLQNLLDSFLDANAFKDGIPVAIIGQPNSGKSTLMNVLVKDDRSIVSSIKGTTRDTIEDNITINGIQFRFIDTAGIRQGKDEIEIQGIQRSFKAIEKAKVILLLQDLSEVFAENNINQTINSLKIKQEELLKDISDIDKKNLVSILNKTDKVALSNQEIELLESEGFVLISALEKKGIETLVDILTQSFDIQNFADRVMVSSLRHYQAMQRSLNELLLAGEANNCGLSSDLIAENIRQAINHLSEITGEITSSETLNNIFSSFCIGK